MMATGLAKCIFCILLVSDALISRKTLRIYLGSPRSRGHVARLPQVNLADLLIAITQDLVKV